MSVFSGPDLITNSLVFHLDSADPRCYSGGSTCRDLAGINGNGTLTNITYTSDKVFFFNGTNSNISFTRSYANITNSVTFSVLAGFVSYEFSPAGIGLMMSSLDSNYIGINISSAWAGGNNFIPIVEVYDGVQGNNIIPVTEYNGRVNFLITAVVNGQSLTMYLNNILIDTVSVVGLNLNAQNTIDFGFISNTIGAEAFPNSQIYKGLIYNRPLTHREVIQNYNAMKGRARLS